MFTVTINGNTLEELFGNFETLLKSKPGATAQTTAPTATVPAAATLPATPPQALTTPPVAQAPIAPPVAQTPQTPAEQAPAAQTPTAALPPQASAPTYTLDQLARAGAALAQSGKMEQALALLAKYGVQTVNQLQPDQYGAFATELRALGAQV